MITQPKVQPYLSKILFFMVLSAAVFSCKKSDNTKPPSLAPVISYNQKIVSVNVGESIPALIPDSSKGGSVTQYSIYPGLPKGLSLNQANGVISGTPSDSLNPTRFIISAYGPGGLGRDTITVAVGTVGFVYGATGSYTFTLGSQDLSTTALTPTVLAGTFKKFFVDPNTTDFTAKTGLSFDPATGKITGIPNQLTSKTETSAPYQLIVTGVTNDNKVAYDTLNITINDAVPVVAYPFRGAFTQGVPMGGLLIPAVTTSLSGNLTLGKVIKYRLAPGQTLPDGVHLDSINGTVGLALDTPRVALPTGNITVRAINTGGYTDVTMPLVINTDPVTPQIKFVMTFYSSSLVDSICPSINSGDNIYVTKSDAIGNVGVYLNAVLTAGQPLASSGYSVAAFAPSNLTGMSLSDGTKGVYSGTPSAAANTYTSTLTIKNAAGAAYSNGTFGLNVIVNAPFFTYNNGGTKLTTGTASTNPNVYSFIVNKNVKDSVAGQNFAGYTDAQLAPTLAAGLNASDFKSFAIYPATIGSGTSVPAFAKTGMTFNTATGAISGTPTISNLQQFVGGYGSYWDYIIVGKKTDGSFTYYKIRFKIYSAAADFNKTS